MDVESTFSRSFFFTIENLPLWLSILSLLTLCLGISRSGSKLKKASYNCLHAGSGSLALSVLFWSMYERSVSAFNDLIAEIRVDVLRIFMLRSRAHPKEERRMSELGIREQLDRSSVSVEGFEAGQKPSLCFDVTVKTWTN